MDGSKCGSWSLTITPKKPQNLFLGFLKTSYVKFFQIAVLKKEILFKHGLLQALFKVLLL